MSRSDARQVLFIWWALASAFYLASCQTSGETLSDAIGKSYALMTTAAHDVESARTSGVIPDSKALEYKAQLQRAKTNLDAASAEYAAGNTAGVSDRIQTTQIVLHAIIKAITDLEAARHGGSTGVATAQPGA